MAQLDHDAVRTESDDDIDAIRMDGIAADDTLENAENDQYDGRVQFTSTARHARNGRKGQSM